ncbi:MAG: histidine kinase [Herminiimonas sp.]|nr:histidine kinase [Herminiimonas sp.]
MPTDDQQIRSRLSAARLPVMPHILLHLIERCQSDDCSIGALAQLVSYDPGMSARLLKVASNRAYSRGGNLPSLERALTAIGLDMARTLVVTESIYQTFNQMSPEKGFSLHQFWKHSIRTAIASRLIASHLKYADVEEAYLAGLLHDVGRLALLTVAPQEYGVHFFSADDPGLCAMEDRILQTTHPEAGAWLVGEWNLDSFMADSVLYHHEPLARLKSGHPLVHIVALADMLANLDGSEEQSAVAGDESGLGPAQVEALRVAVDLELQKVADFLKVDLTLPDPVPPRVQPSVQPDVQPSAQWAATQKLQSAVRDMAIASNTSHVLAERDGEADCIDAILQAATSLFDMSDAIVFKLDADGKALFPTSAEVGGRRLAGLRLPLDNGGSLAGALKSGKVVCIPNSDLPAIEEEQLLRLLGQSAAVAIPMGPSRSASALLVGAFPVFQLASIQQRSAMLAQFGLQAGMALQSAISASTAAVTSAKGSAALQESAAEAHSTADDLRMASRRIAHEVNNPLAIMKNYLAVLNRKLGKNAAVEDELTILGEEIDRVSRLVNDAGDTPVEPLFQRADLNTAIGRTVKMFQESGTIPPEIQMSYRRFPQPIEVAIDPNHLHQMLLNLIKNAIEAMQGPGRIDITNWGTVVRDDQTYAEIMVRDNGPGIPGDVYERLYSPVRTKKGNEHQGIGLNIVYDLVTKCGGHIICRSDDSGTLFEILLPVTDQNEDAGDRPSTRETA